MLRHSERAATPSAGRLLVVGCGALARELVELTGFLPNVDIACLPPSLHNRPGGIPVAVRAKIHEGRTAGYDRVFVAYADCGTGGLLDRVLAEEGVERLPGAHCYEFFAGRTDFAALADEEPATFWLTDFLARNFDRLVIRGLGIDRHPELESMYFGNYRRLVYLSQTRDAELLALAQAAAARLGLAFEHRHTGYGELATSLAAAGAAMPPAMPPADPLADSRRASTSDEIGGITVRSARRTSSGTGPDRPASGTGRPARRGSGSDPVGASDLIGHVAYARGPSASLRPSASPRTRMSTGPRTNASPTAAAGAA